MEQAISVIPTFKNPILPKIFVEFCVLLHWHWFLCTLATHFYPTGMVCGSNNRLSGNINKSRRNAHRDERLKWFKSSFVILVFLLLLLLRLCHFHFYHSSFFAKHNAYAVCIHWLAIDFSWAIFIMLFIHIHAKHTAHTRYNAYSVSATTKILSERRFKQPSPEWRTMRKPKRMHEKYRVHRWIYYMLRNNKVVVCYLRWIVRSKCRENHALLLLYGKIHECDSTADRPNGTR